MLGLDTKVRTVDVAGKDVSVCKYSKNGTEAHCTSTYVARQDKFYYLCLSPNLELQVLPCLESLALSYQVAQRFTQSFQSLDS
jgi:hypothetical protein